MNNDGDVITCSIANREICKVVDPAVIEKETGTTRSGRGPRSRLGGDSHEKCVCLQQVSFDDGRSSSIICIPYRTSLAAITTAAVCE